MDKELHLLKNKMTEQFTEIGGREINSILSKNNDSLFLSVTECGLKWQKKKIENLFEQSALHKDEISDDTIKSEYVTECLKPSKRDFYFINLNGLIYLESKKEKKIANKLSALLQDNFYQEIKWTLKDEEKLIVTLLLLFNALNSNNTFKFEQKTEDAIWEFMKVEISNGLSNIGICSSFEEKVQAKSTKYASGKNFMSGHPNLLSRSGLFIPNNGEYHLELNTVSDYEFLVSLLFEGCGYSEKLEYVNLIDDLGRELFMNSILTDIFELNEQVRKTISH